LTVRETRTDSEDFCRDITSDQHNLARGRTEIDAATGLWASSPW